VTSLIAVTLSVALLAVVKKCKSQRQPGFFCSLNLINFRAKKTGKTGKNLLFTLFQILMISDCRGNREKRKTKFIELAASIFFVLRFWMIN
jgi:hypothetical protein